MEIRVWLSNQRKAGAQSADLEVSTAPNGRMRVYARSSQMANIGIDDGENWRYARLCHFGEGFGCELCESPTMHVISQKALRTFWDLHPDAEEPLMRWYRLAGQSEWKRFADVREDMGGGVDQVGKFTVFNVGGNKYRLIVAIHFDRERLYVRHVLTHSEYDKGKWKQDRRDKG